MTKKRKAAVLRAEGWSPSEAAKEARVREAEIREWEDGGDEEYWETLLETQERSFLSTYALALAVMRQEMRSDDGLARWRAADSVLRHVASIKMMGNELGATIGFDELDDEDLLHGPFSDDEEV